jgi:3D (Asp-Asp-Asp) domain-containing protein
MAGKQAGLLTIIAMWLAGVTQAAAMDVTIDIEGEFREATTEQETVAELLEELQIEFSALDRIFPPPTALVTPGSFVVIRRAQVVEELPVRSIPPATQFRLDEALPPGATAILRPGTVGEVREVVVTYPADDPDGLDPERHLVVLTAPEDRLVSIGAADSDAAPLMISRGAMAVRATAYCPGGGAGPRTATGLPATYGVVAVDPHFVPLGAHVYIERYGHAIAADTGGAIKGRIIDVCYDSTSTARAFGRRTVTARILD